MNEVPIRAEQEKVIQEHYAPIYRFLRNLARRNEDAEDLSQQTFVRAFAAWHRYDERVPVRSWLYAIAFNEFCKLRRRRLWLPLHPDRPSKDDSYSKVDDAEALLDAIARLGAEVRATFLLHYVEELSIIEISNLMQIPEGTVKSRLSAARTRLKDLIQEAESYVPETV